MFDQYLLLSVSLLAYLPTRPSQVRRFARTMGTRRGEPPTMAKPPVLSQKQAWARVPSAARRPPGGRPPPPGVGWGGAGRGGADAVAMCFGVTTLPCTETPVIGLSPFMVVVSVHSA